MYRYKTISLIVGFLLLFAIYHFPEFFSAFWLMATFKIGFLVVAYFLANAQGWKGLAGFGLSMHTKWFKNLIIGLLLGLCFFSLSFFLSVQFGYEKITGINAFTSIIKQVPMILLMTAIPSMAEDILTRGYIYAHLSRSMKSFLWILLSSTIYVLNHIWRLDDGPAVIAYLFLLGVVLAYAMWMTKSIWLAFGIHWGANIAFESIRSFIHTTSIGEGAVQTCILAGTWTLLLLLLAITGVNKKISGVHYQ